ncbi:MAG: hypothetical protein ACTSYZ_11300 [Candidatus Helarchaeota archaeon]
MLSVQETNNLIEYTSKIFDKLFAGRFLVESKLFPVSEYVLVACVNAYEKFYEQLKKLNDKISAKQIARREKGKLFTEITPLHIFDVHMFPLFGRMCRISNVFHNDPMKESEEKFDQIRYILTFWKELASEYYGGPLSVDEMDGKCQIASSDSLNIIKDHLQSPSDQKEVSQVRKMVAHLEQLAFLDECESRMKISNHGPYYTDLNEKIVVTEIIHLYDGKKAQWPWSETKDFAPYSNLLIAYQLSENVKCKFNDWGTLITDPIDFKRYITKYCLISKKNNKLIQLGLDDVKDFETYSKSAHKELYIKFAKWSKKERLEAGALVYNKNFDRFTNIVNITDKIDWSISENVKNFELKHFLNNEIIDFRVGNWVMRSNRKRKIHPTYFKREIVDLKRIGGKF